jgi:hypothetical protein
MKIKKPQQPKTTDPATLFKLPDNCKDNLAVRTIFEMLNCCGIRSNELINIK